MAYGLRPYKGLGGGYHSGGFSEYPILDNDTEKMFTGDFMERETNGYVTRTGDTTGASPTGASAALTTIGPAVGFRYLDADGKPKWSTWYDGNASNTKAFAMVADDPAQSFTIMADNLVTAYLPADDGMNAGCLLFAVGDANEASGISGMTLDITSAAATAALALRIIGTVKNGENEDITAVGTPIELIVRINPIAHAYASATVAPA
jgi:hypothetical protein